MKKKYVNYIIIWADNTETTLKPGDITRTIYDGEILYVNRIYQKNGLIKTRTVAIGLVINYTVAYKVVQTLLRYYRDADYISKLTQVPSNQVRQAIINALKSIIHTVKAKSQDT